MNKTELIAAMAEASGLSKKDCEAALAAFITTTSPTASDCQRTASKHIVDPTASPVRRQRATALRRFPHSFA